MLEKILDEYGVIKEQEEYSIGSSYSVVLTFQDEHTNSINRKINAPGGLEGIKVSAEMIAKMHFNALPFNTIEDIRIIEEQPYKIEIRAIKPMVTAFVMKLLNN